MSIREKGTKEGEALGLYLSFSNTWELTPKDPILYVRTTGVLTRLNEANLNFGMTLNVVLASPSKELSFLASLPSVSSFTFVMPLSYFRTLSPWMSYCEKGLGSAGRI